jgi:hypothetical protein
MKVKDKLKKHCVLNVPRSVTVRSVGITHAIRRGFEGAFDCGLE